MDGMDEMDGMDNGTENREGRQRQREPRMNAGTADADDGNGKANREGREGRQGREGEGMSEETKRVRLSRRKGWRMPANAVNVARPGPWGNPFRVGVHGDAAECVRKFRLLLAGKVCVGDNMAAQVKCASFVKANLWRLAGKDVVCWCRLDKPCHGDVLLEAVRTATANRQAAEDAKDGKEGQRRTASEEKK